MHHSSLPKRLTRRDFLRLATIAGAGAGLAACAPALTQAPAATQALATSAPATSGQKENVTLSLWTHSAGNPNAMTAAHRTLPFGTRVRVTHAATGRSVDVRINDRGPYIAGRIIDLSRAAAGVIGMTGQGIARVRVSILGR